MAALRNGQSKFSGMMRVSPLKPGLRGSQNWMASKVRAAKHSRKAMMRFIASILATLSFLIFIALWLGGFLPTIRHNLHVWKVDRLMAMGFVVEQVDIMGEGRLNEADIRAAISIYEGSYFFGLDLDAAQSRTESLPWVERAVVRRLWPNRVVVQVVETTPYALWQHQGELHLLNDAGAQIVPVTEVVSLPENLKTYVGVDAPQAAKAIEATLSAYPQVWERTESLVHFASGRWDLHLANDTVIRLPVENADAALQKLVEIDRETFILSREVGTIDMRLSDRISLSPKPTPADPRA